MAKSSLQDILQSLQEEVCLDMKGLEMYIETVEEQGMSEEHKKILKKHLLTFIDYLDLASTIDVLYKYDIVDDHQYDEIPREKDKRRDGIRNLITTLRKKNEKAFYAFVFAIHRQINTVRPSEEQKTKMARHRSTPNLNAQNIKKKGYFSRAIGWVTNFFTGSTSPNHNYYNETTDFDDDGDILRNKGILGSGVQKIIYVNHAENVTMQQTTGHGDLMGASTSQYAPPRRDQGKPLKRSTSTSDVNTGL